MNNNMTVEGHKVLIGNGRTIIFFPYIGYALTGYSVYVI